MKEVAIYGKGGIGKSTLTSNISAALAIKGKKILQIGCDPKHDSTVLLLGGRRITTVLDYIKQTGPLEYNLNEVLFSGYMGIGCIEAGGPKPGVGCAGRGIITAFDFLDKFHIKYDYDLIMYDVLGDVVCGGFAVPIRNEYADEIYIVSSGEYMSLYAANNILRGIQNYGKKNRVAGILFNARNLENEEEKVRAFADATGLPIFASVPRAAAFERAERLKQTTVEAGEKELADIFIKIADDMLAEHELHAARPLTDEELEECIMNVGINGKKNKVKYRTTDKENFMYDSEQDKENQETKIHSYEGGYLSKNVIREEPLHGCAFNGAVTMGIHLKDAVILAHSPRSCTYLSYQTVSSSGRRALFERGTVLSSSLIPNLLSTDMDEGDMVFGGTDKLIKKVRSLMDSPVKPRAIVIISSCPSGIIGDDIDKAKEYATPETPIITIKTDGNLNGDYLQGMLLCYTELARQVIDKETEPEGRLVNIVFEKVVSKNTETNFKVISGLLSRMGIEVNCRFLTNTSYDQLAGFKRASLNLLAYKDYTGLILEDFFKKNYGLEFFERQFPVGFAETEKWILGIGDYFGERNTALEVIAEHKGIYKREIAKVRKKLEGKTLMIVTYNHDVDWILRAALDCGMKVIKVGILNFSQDEGFRSELDEIDDIDVVEKYNRDDLPHDIELLKPEILLTNYQSAEVRGKHFTDTIPMCPDVGFYSGLDMVKRWGNLMKNSFEGEWQNDKYLLDKYYT